MTIKIIVIIIIKSFLIIKIMINSILFTQVLQTSFLELRVNEVVLFKTFKLLLNLFQINEMLF